MRSSAHALVKTGRSFSEYTITGVTLLALNALLIIPVTGAVVAMVRANV